MKLILKIFMIIFCIGLFNTINSAQSKSNSVVIFSLTAERDVPSSLRISKLRDKIFSEIGNSAIFGSLLDTISFEQNLDSSSIGDPVKIMQGKNVQIILNSSSMSYLIDATLHTRNQLFYLTAGVYHIYSNSPIKYIELFTTRTKYYYPFSSTQSIQANELISEFLKQLNAGFDDKINVVFKKMKIDTFNDEHKFLANAVPEYLKSRLVISNKIKVYRDSIITNVPGVKKKPHYTIDAYAFDDRDRVHIISNCNDNEEDRVIITKQISFSIENPENLDLKLHEIGDEFRNAILRLYDSKIHQRLSRFAIVAKPTFFIDPQSADHIAMNDLSRKIIYSLISSFHTDINLKKYYELVEDPSYFDKLEVYLSSLTEPSVITNDLNADILISMQTIGNPSNFDIKIDMYDPKAARELKRIIYHTEVKPTSLKDYINNIYTEIRDSLFSVKNIKYASLEINSNSEDVELNYKQPSEFFRLIPRKIGFRINGLHSLFFPEYGDMFFGNHLRPAVEVSGFYSSAIFDIPFSADVGFIYDFGNFRDYADYGDTTGSTGTIYARNLNLLLKVYLPFYGRVKNRFRYYGGLGITLIDIHRVSKRVSAGSFDAGIILIAGLEYSFTNNIFLDMNARFMASDKMFKTLDKFKDADTMQLYRVFYLGAGIGYEF